MRMPITSSSVPAFLESEIMNISKGGVFIRADIVLPLGSLVDFEFSLPDRPVPVKATGVVVWARAAGKPTGPGFPEHLPGMGVQFREIAADDLDRILDELEKLAAG
jgi:uncharacterized protein (TIGR02266 family)